MSGMHRKVNPMNSDEPLTVTSLVFEGMANHSYLVPICLTFMRSVLSILAFRWFTRSYKDKIKCTE